GPDRYVGYVGYVGYLRYAQRRRRKAVYLKKVDEMHVRRTLRTRRTPRTLRTLRTSLTCALLLLPVLATGQAPRRADWVRVTPLVETETVHAGSTARIALQIKVADGLHVQANHPRDPSLVPMGLWIDTPPDVTFAEVVFPASTDYELTGYAQPLAVFEGDVVVGGVLRIGKTQPAGPMTL